MRTMLDHVSRPALAAAVLLLAGAAAPAAAQAEEPFPPPTPQSVGLSAEALEALAAEVTSYIDREMAVGAELLVIKDRRSVLHEAFGWRDREAEVPMERDTLFNIRSMTKPVTGAAAQTLIDDGLLALACLLVLTSTPAAAQAEEAFPPATPESVGLSAEALGALADEVQRYIDRCLLYTSDAADEYQRV